MSDPLSKPGAEAVTVTGCAPSGTPSSSESAATATLASPSGSTTVGGTASSPASLDCRFAVRSPAVGPLRDTVSVTAPVTPSGTAWGARSTARAGPSSSVTWIAALARPAAIGWLERVSVFCATISAACGPSSRASSTA